MPRLSRNLLRTSLDVSHSQMGGYSLPLLVHVEVHCICTVWIKYTHPMECIDCVEDKKEHRIRKRLRTMSFGLIREEPWYLNDPRTDPNYKGPYTEHYHPDYRGERFSSILEEG